MSNAAAGSIIGKVRELPQHYFAQAIPISRLPASHSPHRSMQGGANINEFQGKSFARIQLSKSGEYYPGTTERTLLVTGRLKQIIGALTLILAKLLREGVAPLTPKSRSAAEDRNSNQDATGGRLAIKLLVPQPLCGIIIGKGGATVRAYSQQTNTSIRVTASDGPAVHLNHRIVTITGGSENVLRAIALLIVKQTEDPKYAVFADLPGGGWGTGIAVPPYETGTLYNAGAMASYQPHYYMDGSVPGSHGVHMYGAASLPGMYGASSDGSTATVQYQMAEEHAAALLGKPHGQGSVEELQTAAGVTVAVDRLDAGQSTGVRLVQLSIVGSPQNVSFANFLISQRYSAMVQPQYQSYMGSGAGYYGSNGTRRHHDIGGYRGIHHFGVQSYRNDEDIVSRRVASVTHSRGGP